MQLIGLPVAVVVIAASVTHCSQMFSEASRIASERGEGATVGEPIQRIPESELPVEEGRR